MDNGYATIEWLTPNQNNLYIIDFQSNQNIKDGAMLDN